MSSNIFSKCFFESEKYVLPDNLKGNEENIIKILRYMPKVVNQGISEHFFLIADDETDNISLIDYVAKIVKEEFNMLYVYVDNEKGETIEDFVKNIIESLFNELNDDNKHESVIEKFFEGLDEKLSFNSNSKFIHLIKNNFSALLVDICEDMFYEGLFLVINNISSLSKNERFPSWYKSMSEKIIFDDDKFSISFIFIGTFDDFIRLNNSNPSFS